jgi:predicted nucleic acid-binding Zn ribbon protein
VIFEYKCQETGEVIERSFTIGQAEKVVKCNCGCEAKRFFGSMNFQLKGGGWPGKSSKFNKEMTKKNEDAGKRMRKEHDPPPKLIDQR